MNFLSKDPPATVSDFFATQLNNGDWTITSVDPSTSVIKFQRVSHPQTKGDLAVVVIGDPTQIRVRLES